jgi:hypothetical protein
VGLQTHCQCAEKLRSSESLVCLLSRWTRVASDAAKREFFSNTQIAQTRVKTILFFGLFCDFGFIHIKKMVCAKRGSNGAHFLGLFRMFWEPKEVVGDSVYRRFWRSSAMKASRSLSGCSRGWLRPAWGSGNEV